MDVLCVFLGGRPWKLDAHAIFYDGGYHTLGLLREYLSQDAHNGLFQCVINLGCYLRVRSLFVPEAAIPWVMFAVFVVVRAINLLVTIGPVPLAAGARSGGPFVLIRHASLTSIPSLDFPAAPWLLVRRINTASNNTAVGR